MPDIRIKDISARFPGKRPSRPLSKIARVVIHHDAVAVPAANQAAVLKRLDSYDAHHRANGWGRIGYAYVIPHFPDTVYKCSPASYNTVHAACANTDGIGIMLMGNFMETDPTAFQLQALEYIMRELRENLPNCKRWVSHRNVRRRTDCPGDRLTEAILQAVATRAGF